MMKKKVKHGISVVVLAVFVFLALGSATLTSKQRKETYARADEYTRTGDSYAEQGQYEQALEEYRKGFAELDRLSSFFSNPNNDASELQKDFKARKSAVQQRLFNADIAWLNQKRANAPSAAAAAQAPGQAAAPELPVTEADFTFVQDAQNNLTITGYTGKAKRVEIPATISGLKVTKIGDGAFRGKGLTTVTIPNGVQTIGDEAFVQGDIYRRETANKFPNLVIPDSVTSIGKSAFANCGITTLRLGNGLITIGEGAFTRNAFEVLAIPASVTRIEASAFANCGIKTLTLGKGLQYIGVSAFANNAFEVLVIPDSVTQIAGQSGSWGHSRGAFANCGIKTLTLGKGLTAIEAGIFMNNKLTKLILPASIREIHWYAFRNNQLTALVIPNGVTFINGVAQYVDQNEGGGAFGENPITSLTIPPSLASCDYGRGFKDSFKELSLTRITLPANVNEENVRQFGEGFVNFWENQNRKAGTYVFNRIWTLE